MTRNEMKSRIAVLALALATLSSTVFAQAQATAAAPQAPSSIDPAKAQLIRHLMDVMKVSQNFQQMIGPMTEQMAKSIHALVPTQSAKAQQYQSLVNEIMVAKVKQLDLGELFVPLYDKYYTSEEIKGLADFYGSALGQKSLQVQKQMSVDVIGLLMPMMQHIVRDADEQVHREHPELFTDH
jgi:uncharacterized protein